MTTDHPAHQGRDTAAKAGRGQARAVPPRPVTDTNPTTTPGQLRTNGVAASVPVGPGANGHVTAEELQSRTEPDRQDRSTAGPLTDPFGVRTVATETARHASSKLWRGLKGLVPRRLRQTWIVRLTVDTIRLVRRNRALGISAEVSFWAVLSITPLLLVSAAALGWLDVLFGLDVADEARDQMTRFVREFLGIGDPVVDAIDELFDAPDPARLTFGILTLLYASSRGFTSLVGGIDHLGGRERKRNWLTTRITGIAASILAVPAIVGVLVALNLGRRGFDLPDPWGSIMSFMTWPMVVLFLTACALWLLHAAPAQKTPLVNDLLGAIVTVAIWIGGSWVTSRFLINSNSTSDVLGLLGGSVGLLIWLYIMTSGIMIGAQVNVALHEDRQAARRVARAGPMTTTEAAIQDTVLAQDPSPNRAPGS